MVDRVLRGSHMGAVLYETDRDHGLASRMVVHYHTESGEIFEVPFADSTEIPGEWLCKNGQIGELVEDEDVGVRPMKSLRTHWGMLRERRPIGGLNVPLDKCVGLLRKHHRSATHLLKAQKKAEEAGKNA